MWAAVPVTLHNIRDRLSDRWTYLAFYRITSARVKTKSETETKRDSLQVYARFHHLKAIIERINTPIMKPREKRYA